MLERRDLDLKIFARGSLFLRGLRVAVVEPELMELK